MMKPAAMSKSIAPSSLLFFIFSGGTASSGGVGGCSVGGSGCSGFSFL